MALHFNWKLLTCVSFEVYPWLSLSSFLPCSFSTQPQSSKSFLSLISFRESSIAIPLNLQIFQLCHSFYPSEILLKYIPNKANMSLPKMFSYQLLKRKKIVCVYSMVRCAEVGSSLLTTAWDLSGSWSRTIIAVLMSDVSKSWVLCVCLIKAGCTSVTKK